MKLFADMDDATPPDSIIASSSSGITPSVMRNASVPSVALSGILSILRTLFRSWRSWGVKTTPEAIQQAMTFYASIGKKPILLRKEFPGHVGNRLQAALYREVAYLIEQGVLSVAEADDAVSYGPGLRWGVMGPSLQWHLGGGAGGIKHFMEHLMDPMGGMWKVLRESRNHT